MQFPGDILEVLALQKAAELKVASPLYFPGLPESPEVPCQAVPQETLTVDRNPVVLRKEHYPLRCALPSPHLSNLSVNISANAVTSPLPAPYFPGRLPWFPLGSMSFQPGTRNDRRGFRSGWQWLDVCPSSPGSMQEPGQVRPCSSVHHGDQQSQQLNSFSSNLMPRSSSVVCYGTRTCTLHQPSQRELGLSVQTLQMTLQGMVERASGRRDGVLLNTMGLQFTSPVNQIWFLVCEEVHTDHHLIQERPRGTHSSWVGWK